MNSQSFDVSKENGRKQFDAFLKVLLDYNIDKENDDYNDIHIRQEEMFMIIEWDKVPYNHEWGGTFQYIDSDDVVMKEVTFPDRHCEYLFPEEVENTLKEWKEKHPEWIQTSYGTWTNTEENRIATIDWRSKEWMEKEVEDGDSTFSESVFEFKDGDDLAAIIAAPDDDLLKRTEFVALSKVLFNKVFSDRPINEYSVCKIENVGDILVYVTDYLTDDAIYYVTDTKYLIHREKVEFKK